MTTEEARNYVLGTKVSAGNKSKEIQEKIFKLGYRWRSGDSSVENLDYMYIYIYRDYITKGKDVIVFNYNKNREISADDILNIKIESKF